MFKLYWFNVRTGSGHPALDYPGEYSYNDAFGIVKKRRENGRWDKRGFELRYEPVEVHQKYTVQNKPV